MRRKSWRWASGLVVAAAWCGAVGCDESDPPPPAAPAASAPAPAGSLHVPEGATPFAVKTAGSRLSWVMDAPFEKIHGEIAGGLSGELAIDPRDLTRTRGALRVDVRKLDLYQQRRASEQGEFGERSRSDKQNEDARGWLEIGPDTPPEALARHGTAEFSVTALVTSTSDVTKLSGAERKVTGTLSGNVSVHGRALPKSVPFEAVFRYQGERLEAIAVRTTGPLVIGLEEYDIRPRTAFGKLAQKTLGDLAGKVSKEAPVNAEFTLEAR